MTTAKKEPDTVEKATERYMRGGHYLSQCPKRIAAPTTNKEGK